MENASPPPFSLLSSRLCPFGESLFSTHRALSSAHSPKKSVSLGYEDDVPSILSTPVSHLRAGQSHPHIPQTPKQTQKDDKQQQQQHQQHEEEEERVAVYSPLSATSDWDSCGVSTVKHQHDQPPQPKQIPQPDELDETSPFLFGEREVIGVTADGVLMYKHTATHKTPSKRVFETSLARNPRGWSSHSNDSKPKRHLWRGGGGSSRRQGGSNWTEAELAWGNTLLQFRAKENAPLAQHETLLAAMEEWKKTQTRQPEEALERRWAEQKAHQTEWPPFVMRW